jgi:hypothetical protein
MSDIKLFRIDAGKVDELTGTTDTIEKSVQTLDAAFSAATHDFNGDGKGTFSGVIPAATWGFG